MSVSRIHRLLRLITILQSGRSFTTDELAVELEVSRRTVFRDLNMLELAHIPYYFDAERRTYRIGEHFFLPPMNLTLSEALCLLLLTRRVRQGSIPLLSQSTRAAMKIESSLPAPLREHLGSMIEHVDLSLGPVSRHEGLDAMFDEFTGAIAHRNVCKLVYISFLDRKQLRIEVHPLRLVFHGRAWYLLAYCPAMKESRTFKLGRVRKLEVTQKTYPPDTQRLQSQPQPFGQAWSMIPEGTLYDVHLHVEPKVAGNIAEVSWHASQRVEWNDDGSAEVHFRVDGLREISWWILGYGDQVEVVSPPALRQRIAEVSLAMLARYSQEALRGELPAFLKSFPKTAGN